MQTSEMGVSDSRVSVSVFWDVMSDIFMKYEKCKPNLNERHSVKHRVGYLTNSNKRRAILESSFGFLKSDLPNEDDSSELRIGVPFSSDFESSDFESDFVLSSSPADSSLDFNGISLSSNHSSLDTISSANGSYLESSKGIGFYISSSVDDSLIDSSSNSVNGSLIDISGGDGSSNGGSNSGPSDLSIKYLLIKCTVSECCKGFVNKHLEAWSRCLGGEIEVGDKQELGQTIPSKRLVLNLLVSYKFCLYIFSV